MRTKEKFYENLNNKHVSKEKRLERINLKTVKHIESILKEMSSLKSSGDKIEAKYREEANLTADHYETAGKHEKYQEKLETALESQMKEDKINWAGRQKDIDAEEKLVQKFGDLWRKHSAEANILEDKVRGVEDDAYDLIQKLEQAKKDFIQAGKNIGVDVSSKANSYDHPSGWPWN